MKIYQLGKRQKITGVLYNLKMQELKKKKKKKKSLKNINKKK